MCQGESPVQALTGVHKGSVLVMLASCMLFKRAVLLL